MNDEIAIQKARQVYNSFKQTLDNMNWKYKENDEDMSIVTGVKGDDLPIDLLIFIKPKQEIIQIRSMLPFKMPENKRIDGAIAVCVANYGMVDGSFDYDIKDGEISFRITSSYRESEIGADLFEYMIYVCAGTTDNYNDKFCDLANNKITLQEFIQQNS